MYLTQMKCERFRCLAEVCFAPEPGINVIRGDNAQGKTTLLEAILFAATSKSHRTASEGDLVQYGAEGFSVRTWAQRADREITIEANWWQGAKRFKVNGVAQTRLSDILGRLNVVLFSPEDVELVKGGAASRRRFLDMEISQIDAGYLNALQQYRQVLRQRNELLRVPQPDPSLVAVWDAQLARHGASVITGRAGFIEELSGRAAQAYARIAESESFAVAYQPDVRSPEDLAAVLDKSRDSDIRRRMTQRGPHRDDLEILIGEHPARHYGSQGQQKTAALALRLAELDLVRAHIGEYPVLLLDEVLAELDAHRAERLLGAIGPEVQCIMTTTERERSRIPFAAKASFRVERGCLEKE